MSNATTSAILDNIRVRLPGVADAVINLELFNTCDELAREALRESPPVNVDADPASWLPAAQWVPNYQALLNGTLYRLHAQLGKPYSSPDLAKLHSERYSAYLDLARTEAATTTTTYDRIVSSIRSNIPMVRDTAIELELYNTIDKIRREALRLTILDESFTDPTDYLPDTATWSQCYQAVLHGALAGLYAQLDKPWANADLAKAHSVLYQQELDLVRGEESSSPTTDLTRLMDLLRVRLPGARDEIIKLELFSTLDEFFRDSNLWQEDIVFPVTSGVTDEYEFVNGDRDQPQIKATYNRLMYILDDNDQETYGCMQQPGVVNLSTAPSANVNYTARFALSVTDPTTSDGYPTLPGWILAKYRDDFLDGVLARMMTQPAKSYSNPTLATYHARRFRNAIAKARAEAQVRNVYRGQSWRFPSFA